MSLDFTQRRFSEWLKRTLVTKGGSPLETLLPDVMPVQQLADVNASELRAFRSEYTFGRAIKLAIDTTVPGSAADFVSIEMNADAAKLAVIKHVKFTGQVPDATAQPNGAFAYVLLLTPGGVLGGAGTAIAQDIRAAGLALIVSKAPFKKLNGPQELNSIAYAQLPQTNATPAGDWFQVDFDLDQVVFPGSHIELGIGVLTDPTTNWQAAVNVFGYERPFDPSERAFIGGAVP